MDDEPWYGARCIFLRANLQCENGSVYEERVILLKAENLDEAIVCQRVTATGEAFYFQDEMRFGTRTELGQIGELPAAHAHRGVNALATTISICR